MLNNFFERAIIFGKYLENWNQKKVCKINVLWSNKNLLKSKMLWVQESENNSYMRQVGYITSKALSPNFASHEMF